MWIICAGAKRSGSTLQYNVLARLVEESGSGKRISHFKPKQFEDIKKENQNYDGFKVIKTHVLYDVLRDELKDGNAILFHSFRDIRDVVVSYINKGWIPKNEDGILKCVREYLSDFDDLTDKDYVLHSHKYEDFAFNISEELKKYSEILEIRLPESKIESISSDLNLERIRKFQDNIQEDKLRESYNNKFHEDTLIHVNHIKDGSVGQYMEFLSPHEITLIESMAHKYLDDNGYKIYWPQTDEFISYSQHADDYLAWQLLYKKKDGIVVEVGAFDGIHLSNSYSLEQLGWKAVCVEPNPAIFKILESNRPNALNYECAVVSDEQVKEIDFFSEELGVLSGCDYDEEDIKKRYENRGLTYKNPEKLKVKARTLNSILGEIDLDDNKVDVITIDVEGFEIEVLKGLDLNTYNVGLFIIEANTKKEIETILKYFKQYPNYLNIGTNRQNMFLLNRLWAKRDCLLNIDFENYRKAEQRHPVSIDLTIDSVPPKFSKTIEFDKLIEKSKIKNIETASMADTNEQRTKNIKIKIAHIVNPVNVGPKSDLHKAQPITFKTMLTAREFAKDVIDVDLITTQYPEDHEIIPTYFSKAPDLERSIMDFGDFEKQRKLPLIRDLLERAAAFSPDSDYIIYTNVDIALQPHFYLFIKQKIEEGLDAFVINRRTISKEYDLDTLAAAYSDMGQEHPGFDCFVFRRNLLPAFKLGTISIGANWIGRTMFANLIAFCDAYELFKHEHLTFHIGEDGAWLVSDFSEFDKHNKEQLYPILEELLEKTTDPEKNKELQDIKIFMDRYGFNPMAEPIPYNPSTWTRIKKKVKKVAKIVLNKE